MESELSENSSFDELKEEVKDFTKELVGERATQRRTNSYYRLPTEAFRRIFLEGRLMPSELRKGCTFPSYAATGHGSLWGTNAFKGYSP